MEPWICPRCGTVWAGWVAKCDCKVPTISATTNSATVCNHTNIIYDTLGLRCLDCGYIFPVYKTIITVES